MTEATRSPGDGAMTERTETCAAGEVAAISHSQHHQHDHQDHQHHHQHHQHHDQSELQQTGQQHSEHERIDIDPALSGLANRFPLANPLPNAFPKKRRGRPPGRPNTTVRDADYEHNPLVQAWNAAKNDRAVPMLSICIRDALTEQSLVHETQRAIFRLPSRETILFVQGWITAKHIASQRPSYVNGLLIHSRGQDAPASCLQCTEKRAKNTLGPFLTCRVLPGSYHNSCSNCKWFDNTSNCSLYTGPKPNRKRKAKDQLPPPPAVGVGPPETADGAIGHDTAISADANGEGSISPTLQPPTQQPPAHHQPEAPEDAQSQPQPLHEADMTDSLEEQQPNMTQAPHATDNSDRRTHSLANFEVAGSEHPQTPSQVDPLADSHFVLPKHNQDGDAHEEDDDNMDSVAAQLAAQLLPELHRGDS
ncbi:hypothetical protein N658DRAFT_506750 [Parathielavia hyrcaniae]|uniref:Uncharacterized protein n=1 Tax=Parathielavia hyrcaniae TaxID=113614 RepID=A0AAN6Q1U6_9PEZI|nr:hypothetical protein N658DRAFT_506750 [Parathielavia hyrcaniae]